MQRGQSGGTRPHRAPPRPAAGWAPVLLAVIPLLLAVLVHRRAFGAFFGTDDFVRLEEAVGLLPASPTLWRLLSEVLYPRLMLRLFAPQPLPFHVVSMALHLVNTAFVFRMGRRAGLTAGASCFAAAIFGAFPLFYTVLLSAVNINDIMALTFVFLALLALETPSLARAVAAVACFALALLSKEAVLFVPFAAVLLPGAGERPPATARRLMPLLVTGVGFAALYLAFRTRGLGTGGPAYAMGFGVHLFHNLMTYALWSVDLVRTVPDSIGLPDAQAWRVGVWPLAIFAGAALLSRARRGTIVFGAAWWLLALLPVLPLVSHTYGHYLYVPLAGFAIAAAGTLEALADGAGSLFLRTRRPAAGAVRKPARGETQRTAGAGRGTEIAAALFALLAIGFALRAEVLLARRATARLGSTQLALDPFTRKMEVALAAIQTLKGQLDRPRDTVVVFTPSGLGRAVSAKTGMEVTSVPANAPSYDVTEAVLGGGRALRLFEPRLDSVVFTNRWMAEYRDFTLYTEGQGGHLQRMGRGPRSHAQFASLMIAGGFDSQAREYLATLLGAYPDDRLIRLLYAAALSKTGAPDSARAQARLLLGGAPSDTITAAARMLIGILDSGGRVSVSPADPRTRPPESRR